MWERRPTDKFSGINQGREFARMANQDIFKQKGFRKLTAEEYELIVNSLRFTDPQKRVAQLYFEENLTSSQIA